MQANGFARFKWRAAARREVMSVEFYCPHCATRLRLPAGCEGQATRCPSCGKLFVIPPAETAPLAASEVPPPAPPRVGEADVRRAKEEVDRLTPQSVALQVELAKLKRRRQLLLARLTSLRSFQRGRQTLDHTVGRIGGFFIAVTAGGMLLTLLARLVDPGLAGYLLAFLIGILLAGLAYVPYSFFPDDARLAALIPPLRPKLDEITREYQLLAEREAAQRQQLDAAEAEYRRLQAELENRFRGLRNCGWQSMTGKNFEHFLTRLFEEHGYTVAPGSAAAGQRADLVVARDDLRVAVLAKGFVSTTVGTNAVQQAQAAMAAEGCARAGVITNSRFSESAKQLAASAGVRVIDAAEIPALIDGQITV